MSIVDTVIGGIGIKISADDKDFKRGMSSTQKSLKKARKTLNKNAASWAKWGGAVVAASTAAAAAIFQSQAKTIDQLAKTADKLGVTTEALVGLRLAAEQTGVSSGALDKALLKMTVGIAEATQGTGLAKDAIDELGLSAETLSEQSPEQAMKSIADAMQGVEKQTDKVRIAYDLFGARGTGLINTLALGSEGLNQFEQDAKDLGIAISRVDAAKVEAANDALNITSKVIDGVLQEATVQLAPLVTALAASFTDAAKEAGGMGDAIGDTFDGIIDGVGFVLDAIDGIDRVFEALGKSVAVVSLGMVETFAGLADVIVNGPVQAANLLIETINSLARTDIPTISFTEFGQGLRDEIQLMRDASAIGMEDIGEIFNRARPSEGLKRAVQEARVASEELAMIAQRDRMASEAVDFATEEGGGGKVAKTKEETAAILAELEARHAAEAELNAAKFEFDAEAFATSLLTKQELTDFHNEEAARKSQEHEQVLEDIKRTSADAQAMVVVDGLGRMLGAMAANGKKGEGLYRGLAIVQTLISGQRAAVSAWAAGMEAGGPAGPAVAAAYTAASIATTGGMIARLKSGSKSNSKPGGATPSASTGSALGNGGNGLGSDNKRSFDITLVGSTFSAEQVRELMGKIGEEMGDGVEFN